MHWSRGLPCMLKKHSAWRRPSSLFIFPPLNIKKKRCRSDNKSLFVHNATPLMPDISYGKCQYQKHGIIAWHNYGGNKSWANKTLKSCYLLRKHCSDITKTNATVNSVLRRSCSEGNQTSLAYVAIQTNLTIRRMKNSPILIKNI